MFFLSAQIAYLHPQRGDGPPITPILYPFSFPYIPRTIAYQFPFITLLIVRLLLKFNSTPMTHIQKALKLVDDRGRYQKILLAIFILIYIQLGLILLGSSFVYMNPIYQCQGIDSPTEDDACKIGTCRIVNDYTATNYADLVCDRQTERSLIQSFVYIGSIFGLLFITPFADTIGKRKLFILSQALFIFGVVLNLVGVYAKIAAIIIIGQLCVGSGCYSVLIMGYVIISELTEDKFKQYAIILLNVVWALTQIFISGFYFWYNYWANYVIFIELVPSVIAFVAVYIFLVESPYFLLQKKKDIKAALASMAKIAKVNGVSEENLITIEEEFKLALVEYEEREKVAVAHHAGGDSRFAIFKERKYLKLIFVVAILEFGSNAYYYGVQFSLGEIGTDFGHNILLTGLIETTAFFTSNAFITKVPRRMGTLIFNLICIGLGLLFFFEFGMIMQTVLLGACRFFNTYTMAIVPMMQNQPFPHKYRAVAWGYIEGLSQIGNFITPFIVTACQNGGLNPLIVFSFILALLGILPLISYKETLNVTEDIVVQQEQQDLKESIQTDQSSEQIERVLLPNNESNRDL